MVSSILGAHFLEATLSSKVELGTRAAGFWTGVGAPGDPLPPPPLPHPPLSQPFWMSSGTSPSLLGCPGGRGSHCHLHGSADSLPPWLHLLGSRGFSLRDGGGWAASGVQMPRVRLPSPAEVYTIQGNSHGKPCTIPFKYDNQWFHGCTSTGREDGHLWCATTQDYGKDERWGFCPIKSESRVGWASGRVAELLGLE